MDDLDHADHTSKRFAAAPAVEDQLRAASASVAVAAVVDVNPTSFSFANAEHLDRLESSEQVTDIASFQDVELPPPQLDTTGDINSIDQNHYTNSYDGGGSGVRRAKRFYYCLPMMQQYKFVILACFTAFVLVLVAAGMTASSARKANEESLQATALANENHSQGGGGMIINDAPPSPLSSPSSSNQHDEELGDASESENTDETQPPREMPFPTTDVEYNQLQPGSTSMSGSHPTL